MRRGFSLLEVLLALAIVGLVLAAVGPALVGALRAQRQAQRLLDPLAGEQAALALLRDDLAAAPRPNGSLGIAFTATTGQIGRWRADGLSFLGCGSPPIHPAVAARSPDAGQRVIAWTVRAAEDGRGLALVRTAQAEVLATGSAPAPAEEVVLDHLAGVTVEVLRDGAWIAGWSSADYGAVLPQAVRVGLARLGDDGEPGPRRLLVIDLPQMALDPTQQGSGT